MTKRTELSRIRKIAKLAFGRSASNEDVCIEGVDTLEVIIETGSVRQALEFLKANIRTCINAGILTWAEVDDCFTPDELATVDIYTDGRHEINGNGHYIFAGSSIGVIAGYAHVEAYGRALVICEDPSFVWTFNGAGATMKGGMFWSFGSSRVKGQKLLGYAYDLSEQDLCKKSLVHDLKYLHKRKVS